MASNRIRSTLPKITIAYIARESGVSSTTVSLVLRDKPGISSQTRQRVFAKAQSLGYLSQLAPLPASTEVDTIGLLVKVRPDDLAATNSFYAPILAGIEAVCRRQQINLIYANLPVDEQNVPLELPRLLTEQQINGLILIGMRFKAQFTSILSKATVPYLFVDSYAIDIVVDSVEIANTLGMYEATHFLIQKGHRRIALVGSSPDAFPSIQERRAGYRQAMQESDLEPLFVDCSLHEDSATATATAFLRSDPRVTAIIGSNDMVAIAVMRVAQKLGYRIPEDLSIVGFDNIATTKHTTPALTTVRVDKMGMGRLAAQLLLNRIEYPTSSYVKMVIQPSLIERQSVQSIAQPIVQSTQGMF